MDVPPQPDGQGADALCISADVAPSGFVKVTLFDKDDKQLAVGELIPKTVTDAQLKLNDFDAKTFKSRTGGQLLYRQLDVKDPKAGQKYPPLIYFHGWGSRENDNTGVSNGGVGTWEALRRRPRFFAAAAPICGIGHVPSAKTFAKVPIWVFHGDQWSVDDSTRFSQRRLRDGAA